MTGTEKLISDIRRSLASIEPNGNPARAPSLEALIYQHFSFLPESLRQSFSEVFILKYETDREKSKYWLEAVAGIFSQEYDGAKLSLEEWREIRDMISESAGDLPMDLLTSIMSLIVDHKAL